MGEHDLTQAQSAIATRAVAPAHILGDAIAREYESVRRGIAAMVWTSGLAGHGDVNDVADEVLHDVVLRAMAKPEAYDPTRPVRPWLLKFATYVLMNRREKAMRRPSPLSLEARRPAAGGADMEYTLAERLLARDDFTETRAAELLDLVAPADREVLKLHYVEGFRGKEVAAKIGTTEGAARARISRATTRLAVAYHAAEHTTQKGGRQ